MTEEVTQTPEAVAANAGQPQQEENFDLTVQDLAAIKQVFEVATQRGAFKANELAAVGAIYNKLSGFLEGVSKQGQK